MRFQKAAVTLCFVLCGTAIFLVMHRSRNPSIEQVSYPTHHGDSPTTVEFIFSGPSADLNLVRETLIDQEFATDELLSIHGSLALDPQQQLMPLIVRFIEDTSRGDVTGNSTALGEYDPADIEILINAPKTPGKYRLWIGWGSDTILIGRSMVVVRRR